MRYRIFYFSSYYRLWGSVCGRNINFQVFKNLLHALVEKIDNKLDDLNFVRLTIANQTNCSFRHSIQTIYDANKEKDVQKKPTIQLN